MKIFVAHASSFDFKNKLYAPIRESVLNTEHEFFLPQETGDEEVTLETIKNSDALVCEVSMPSTGAGIEMGWASAYGVPILGIYEKGSGPSTSIEYIAKTYSEYSSADEMIKIIKEFLSSLR